MYRYVSGGDDIGKIAELLHDAYAPARQGCASSPSHQGRGVGVTLMNLVEQRAREQGVAELGLDTSEHAAGLIAFYQNHGYRFIEYIQWKETNYRSMIFGKMLRAR